MIDSLPDMAWWNDCRLVSQACLIEIVLVEIQLVLALSVA